MARGGAWPADSGQLVAGSWGSRCLGASPCIEDPNLGIGRKRHSLRRASGDEVLAAEE
jgi:hypothetical protein